MNKRITILSLSVVSLLLTGCASMHVREHMVERHVYPGARTDWNLLTQPEDDPIGRDLHCVMFPFLLVDLPLSAALDTLLLPFDLIDISQHRKLKSNEEQEPDTNNQMQNIGTNAPNSDL